MKQETKIQLLPFEMEMMCNAELILTKNAIMQKLKSFLETVQLKQDDIIKKNIDCLPREVFKTPLKISRGENYKGLPWLVLDYPRHFEKGNIFTIRTMFWWGNFFSITLQLSGRYKEQLQIKILKNKSFFDQHEYYICINNHEWEHTFDEDNVTMVNHLSEKEFEGLTGNKTFLKLSTKFSLDKIADMEPVLCRCYEKLVTIIC